MFLFVGVTLTDARNRQHQSRAESRSSRSQRHVQFTRVCTRPRARTVKVRNGASGAGWLERATQFVRTSAVVQPLTLLSEQVESAVLEGQVASLCDAAKMDTNGDGRVSIQEARDAILRTAHGMGAQAEAVAEGLVGGVGGVVDMAALDTNGDGSVSPEELRAAMVQKSARAMKHVNLLATGAVGNAAVQLRSLSAEIELREDADGYVDVAEAGSSVINALSSAGVDVDEASALLLGPDKNLAVSLAGKVRLSDFRKALTKRAAHGVARANAARKAAASAVYESVGSLKLESDARGTVLLEDAVAALRASVLSSASITGDQVNAILLGLDAELDVDGDGRVSASEFQQVTAQRAVQTLENTGSFVQQVLTKASRRLRFIIVVLFLTSVALNFVAKAGGLTVRGALCAVGVLVTAWAAISMRLRV